MLAVRMPVRIVSDGDRKFDSRAVRSFATSAGIHRRKTYSYKPRKNVKVEKMVGAL